MATNNKKQAAKKQAAVEDLILGIPRKTVKELNIDYENPNITYRITNLKVKNKPIFVNGGLVETFIGSNNLEARKALKAGAKTVITLDFKKNEEYKIEVIE